MNFPQPLRLAVGSHQEGSGKGCAMNIISWENGDVTITDTPPCTHPVLASLVQNTNDLMCSHHSPRDNPSLLCPGCSVKVLALAHRTVGTGTATNEQVFAWFAELIDSPEWGLVRYSLNRQPPADFKAAADLYRRAALGDIPSRGEWAALLPSAGLGCDYVLRSVVVAGFSASYAVETLSITLDTCFRYAVAGICHGEHTASDQESTARLMHAHQAIDAWERTTGSAAPEPDDSAAYVAYTKMTAVAH